MSADAVSELGRDGRLGRAKRTVVETCFGDSAGVTLFLGTLAFFVLTWRVGNFFNDVGLFAAMLPRVASGHLSLGPVSELSRGFPGMYYVGTDVYGRNYGQVVLSLPVYWLVDLLGPALLGWAVVVGWSGLVAAVAVRVASRYDRRRLGLAIGGSLAAATLVANTLTFKPLFGADAAITALQVTSMLAAAMTGVLIYRVVARQAGTRLGAFAGATTVLATPVGFWATVPKRHSYGAFLVVVALYALARSRDDCSTARLGSAGFRAIAYASAGVLAWIHAPEGFTLFLALAVVDLPTAPSNDRRTLAVVAGGFALSLVPFFLTNYLISGNPVEPPRFLPRFLGPGSLPDDVVSNAADTGASGTSGPSGAAGAETSGVQGDGPGTSDDDTREASGLTTALGLKALLPTTLVALLERGVFRYVDGAILAMTEPGRLATVFLRWGRHGYDPGNLFFGGGTNLSVLESAPVAVAVAVAPVRYGIDRLRDGSSEIPVTTTDAFALVFSALLVALYLPNLPLKVMVTVRYLHPIYPLLVYAVFRQGWIRDALSDHAAVAFWGYEAAVLLGTPLVAAGLLLVSASKGDVFQGFALAALAAAGLLAASGVASAATGVGDRATALSFGLAAGVGTVFLLTTALIVMHFGPSALPVVDVLSGELRFRIIS